jgi:glutamyl/glutaminyl-tRNA synthetase
VIRGEDHISNTPKQIRILEALRAPVPQYAHLANILGSDGRKLSKRHGAVSVEEFRAGGYYAPALLNYLALLGWSYDDRREIFSRDELVELFTLERVGASPAVFDHQKLAHLNGLYLRALPEGQYADALVTYLRERGYDWDQTLIRRAAPLVQQKLATFAGFPDFARFLFEPIRPERDLLDGAGPLLAKTWETLAAVEPFEAARIEEALRALAASLELKPGQAFQPIRVAVTGSKVSPGLFESIELLGREETLARLAAASQ